MEAKYTTKDGEERTSLLLASGWWGVARYAMNSLDIFTMMCAAVHPFKQRAQLIFLCNHRHFHYVPEVLAAFFWCVPALFTHPIAYFYPVYLTLLLLDRAWRDDARCGDKYKASWVEYCALVPFRIIPGIV